MEYGPAAYSSEEELDEVEIGDVQTAADEKRRRLLYDEHQAENRDQLLTALDAESAESKEEMEFGGLQKVKRETEEDTGADPDYMQSKETAKKV